MRRTDAIQAASLIQAIVGVIAGLGVLATGVWILVAELRSPPIHTQHVWFSASLMAFGSFLITPKAVGEAFVMIVPYLPIVGGRRALDPARSARNTGPRVPTVDRPDAGE